MPDPCMHFGSWSRLRDYKEDWEARYTWSYLSGSSRPWVRFDSSTTENSANCKVQSRSIHTVHLAFLQILQCIQHLYGSVRSRPTAREHCMTPSATYHSSRSILNWVVGTNNRTGPKVCWNTIHIRRTRFNTYYITTRDWSGNASLIYLNVSLAAAAKWCL